MHQNQFFLLVLRPLLGLPQHAGEVRVVEGNHLRAVHRAVPVKFFHLVLPYLKSRLDSGSK